MYQWCVAAVADVAVCYFLGSGCYCR